MADDARQRLEQDINNEAGAPACTCKSRDFVDPGCPYGLWLAEQYRKW